jgi:predicted outer membrane lipoprotein
MKRESKRLAKEVNRRQISAVVQNRLSRVGANAHAGSPLLWMLTVLLAACAFALLPATPLHAQQHKSKVPLVGKFGSGNRQQAYSGRVQSLDMKQMILNVNSLHGRDSEIFPFKKNVRVESVNGKKMTLSSLRPGSTVLIYFDQKSGERTIKNIVVLSSGKKQAKGKPASSH